MILDFGKHQGRPLAEVDAPYLLFILGRPGIRQKRPGLVRAALDELAGRLLGGGFDDLLAELLAPIPAEVLAQARLRRAIAAEKRWQAEEERMKAHRQYLLRKIGSSPGGRALLSIKGKLPG